MITEIVNMQSQRMNYSLDADARREVCDTIVFFPRAAL